MNYLLVGPEKYLKRQFFEKLKKSVLGDGTAGSSPDFGIFAAGTAPVSEILAFLNTMPFTSEKRLALLNNIDEIPPAGEKSIVKYLKSPRESSVLVMETSSPESWKSAEKIFLPAKIIRCGKLKEREINSWIRKEFAERELCVGEEIPEDLRGTRTCLGAFIDFLEKHDVEPVWTVDAGDPYYALDCREDDYCWFNTNAKGELVPSILMLGTIRPGLNDYRYFSTLQPLGKSLISREVS